MADTQTTNLNLTKPEPGAAEDTWGISLNADLDTLDAIFSSSGTQINLNPNQINFADGKKAVFGAGSDLQIYHDGSNSFINQSGVGDLTISNANDDKDILFKGDDGSGGLTAYFYLDGSESTTRFAKNLRIDDNVKVMFGASNDLQIYHDGSNSYISDQGTNDLKVLATDFQLKNAADSEFMMTAVTDGAVSLYNNGSPKLATTSTGIDVTGTVVSDGLTVDGTITGQNAANGATVLTLNDATGSAVNQFINIDLAKGGGAYNAFTLKYSNQPLMTWGANLSSYANKLYIGSPTGDTAIGSNNTERMSIASNGDISFYNTAGNSQALFWDASAESLGIGTTSPVSLLTVGDNTVNATAISISTPFATNNYGDLVFTTLGTTTYNARIRATVPGNGTRELSFITAKNASENTVMTLDGDGNVGIGTDSPDEKLDITGGFLKFNGGDYGLKSSHGLSYQANEHYFNANGQEAMRITSAKQLLIGRTSTSGISNGHRFDANGFTQHVRAGASVLELSRGTSDGDIQVFKKDSTTVGTVSVTASATAYNTSSDARLKDVTGEARGLEVINELNPVAYNWKADGKADEGLIAQEVQEIVPNAVSGSEEEMYQMDYSKLVVHLVAGMKEQQTQIDALQSEINLLKGE